MEEDVRKKRKEKSERKGEEKRRREKEKTRQKEEKMASLWILFILQVYAADRKAFCKQCIKCQVFITNLF